jgi:hypothetical protein
VRAEAAQRDLVGEGTELEGEGEIGVDAATLARRCHGSGSPVRHAGNNPEVPVSRSRLAAILVALAATIPLVACDDGGSGPKPRAHRSTTTSSTSTTTTTGAGGSTSSSAPLTSSTQPAESIGTCGNQTDAIVAAIGASSTGGLNTRQGQYTVKLCRIAASSPIWAAAAIVPNPGVQADRATVVLQRIGALWNVEAVGTSGVGCDAPANVISDLGLSC